GDVHHLDAGEPHSLHPGDPSNLGHQLAELEAVLRIAVVADTDPGHHHLGLILCDATARFFQDRARGTRACGTADGRDDAVRAMAVTAVLDLDEAARPRHRLVCRLKGQHCVLDVGAG